LPLSLLIIVAKSGWLLKNEADEHGIAFFCATYHHLFSRNAIDEHSSLGEAKIVICSEDGDIVAAVVLELRFVSKCQ
jgi:hypothetical protein